jgi:hypothetical protein
MQEDLQRQGSDESRKSFAPDLRERIQETQAAVIAQTNPARALRAIVSSFRGVMINEYDEEEKIGEPLMNEKGISRITSYLIPIVNDATRFGNVSGTEVRKMTLQICNDITEDIGFNWREYGIRNSSSKDLIVDVCIALVLLTLTRSEEQGEKNWLSRVILESVTANNGGQRPKKESFFSKHFKL